MKIITLLPDEFSSEINSTSPGWESFEVGQVLVNLREDQKIDEVSSFPTPWARMEYVDFAFRKWQGRNVNEQFLTIEQKKIINFTFDLLEILFFKDLYDLEFEFSDVPEFSTGNFFGRAASNFFKFPTPTLIKVRRGNEDFVPLGSTSPYTMVYPAYHNLRVKFPMGNNRYLFDPESKEILLLGKRPAKFLSYLRYLGESLPANNLSPTQGLKIALTTFFNNNEAGVQILEETLLEDETAISVGLDTNSSFPIQQIMKNYRFESNYFYTGHQVIIGGHHAEGINYLVDVPLKIASNYADVVQQPRTILPGTIIKQNWLHESDFFNSRLIKMPYELDGNSFFIGDNNQTKNAAYAPVLSEIYFSNPFHWDSNLIPFYEDNLRIYDDNLKLRAKTRIKLLDNSSTLEVSRLYEQGEINSDIANSFFALKVFPNFYLSNYESNKEVIGAMPYFISILDETGNRNLPISTKLRIFDEKNSEVGTIDTSVRLKKNYSEFLNCLSNLKTDSVPRRIKISLEISASKEVYEVNFLPRYSSKEYRYLEEAGLKVGFDFGTTSSCIAYNFLGANNPLQMANFSEITELKSYSANASSNFINQRERFSKYSFESKAYDEIFRSVVNYGTGLNSFTDWVNFNVYLSQEIPNLEKASNEIRSEFKWDINNIKFLTQAQQWVSHYISSNLLLLKYLLLQKEVSVNLNDIELIWFFPLAFEEDQINTVREIWNSQNIFPKLRKYPEMDESIAPFINSPYYVATNNNKFLNVDIGGGTTDVCMVKGIDPLFKVSMPLAGRNVLGDLYGETNDPLFQNGFVWLGDDRLNPTRRSNKSSHEHFISQSDEIKRKTLVAGSPIIYFFTYCILKYIKLVIDEQYKDELAQEKYPDTIRFSGNGAKMIRNILSNENGIEAAESLRNRNHSLNKLIKCVFDKEIEIEFSKSLKEDTVKGGVRHLIDRTYSNNRTNFSSREFELVGENVNGIAFFEKISSLHSTNGTISISRTNGSYMITHFIKEFIELLEKNQLLFNTLFLLDGETKRKKLIDHLKDIVKQPNYVRLENYIAGGLKSSGMNVNNLTSSLLMFELQGIINELTRVF